MGETALKILSDYGIPGLVIFGLAAAVWFLWKHTKEQQSQLIDLQNLRVAEAKELSKELMEFSQSSNQALGELSAAMTALKEAVLASLNRS